MALASSLVDDRATSSKGKASLPSHREIDKGTGSEEQAQSSVVVSELAQDATAEAAHEGQKTDAADGSHGREDSPPTPQVVEQLARGDSETVPALSTQDVQVTEMQRETPASDVVPAEPATVVASEDSGGIAREVETSSGETVAPLVPAALASSAQEYVRLALKAAVDGDSPRKETLLSAALRVSPDDAAANWHTGRVQVNGQWLPIAKAQQVAAGDAKLLQYRQLRSRAEGDPQRLLSLAGWCNRNKYFELAKLHYWQLLANPATDEKTRQESMRKLELRNYHGLLLTDEEIKQHRETASKIERGLAEWHPRLVKWREAIEGDNDKRRAFAIGQMEQVNDPYVIPAVQGFAADSGERFGQQLVLLTARFGEHEATGVLVQFAVLSPSPLIRQAAIAQLRERPLHDFVPTLLGALVSPFKSQWRIVTDARGNVAYRHVAYQEGQQYNRALATEEISFRRDRVVDREIVREDPNPGLLRHVGNRPAFNNEEIEMQQEEALRAAKQRERELALRNAAIQQGNERTFDALEQLTGAGVQRNPADWWFWWQAYNESVKPKPTQFLYRQSQSSYDRAVVAQYDARHSCFAAGTKVWTETGMMSIEEVQAGDRVLSQDVNTGELTYKLVLRTTAGGATSALMELTVNGEQIYPTLGHVIWVTGKGWRIAKRLNVDDQLHCISQPVRVEDMQPMPAPPRVYNLVVKDFHTYFVGESGMLVHDITDRQPTRALVPGLTPGQVEVSAAIGL